MNIYGRDAEQGGASCLQHFNSLQKRFVFNYDSNLWHMRVCVCVSVPVCVCCSDINRFSFVVPFDSHSGWGRQINDDGNIYDIATATAVVRIMNGLCSSTHQALGQQGAAGPGRAARRQSIRQAGQ